jgi:hypothetical protein
MNHHSKVRSLMWSWIMQKTFAVILANRPRQSMFLSSPCFKHFKLLPTVQHDVVLAVIDCTDENRISVQRAENAERLLVVSAL